jgi:hypothetical protein
MAIEAEYLYMQTAGKIYRQRMTAGSCDGVAAVVHTYTAPETIDIGFAGNAERTISLDNPPYSRSRHPGN